MNAGIYNKISGLVRRSYLSSFTLRRCSGKPKNEESEEPPIPMNTLAHVYSATNQPKNGKVYDNKPFKMPLEAGKPYSWCLCGESKTQPLCDGTHKLQALMITLKPVKFAVAETKEYWICNCKQTKNRPFCDGTHKTIVVDTPVKPHH